MRLLLNLSILLFGLTTALNAQISEQTKTMSLGTRNALVLDLPNTDEKTVANIWQDYTKDFYSSKTKWDRKTKQWITAKADIVALGMGNSVDLYATTAKAGDGVTFTMWTDLGNSFLSAQDNPERYREAEKFLMRFALEVAKEGVKEELNQEEKTLKDFESDLKKLQKDKEGYEKDIERAQEAIRKAEEAIAQNKNDQEDMAKKIELQEEQVKAVRQKLNDL